MDQFAFCMGPWCKRQGGLFEKTGDDWYEMSRMHDDRIGEGPHRFCSRMCAIDWLADQREWLLPERQAAHA